MYYNSEQKLRYIDDCKGRYKQDSTMNNITIDFDTISVYEEKIGKDICNFTVAEILNYYKSLFSNSSIRLNVLNNRLKNYTSWAISNNLVMDHQNHYEEITYPMILNCINESYVDSSIITREELLEVVQGIQNPRDQFLVLGAFEGIGGKNMVDFAMLKMDDFHGNKVNLASGRELTVSNKLVELAKEADTTNIYYFISTKDGWNRDSRKYPGSQPYVVKLYRDIPRTMENVIKIRKSIYTAFVKLTDLYGKTFKAHALTRSGAVDMIKGIYEKESGSLLECIRRHKAEISDRYGVGLVQSATNWIAEYGKYVE